MEEGSEPPYQSEGGIGYASGMNHSEMECWNFLHKSAAGPHLRALAATHKSAVMNAIK